MACLMRWVIFLYVKDMIGLNFNFFFFFKQKTAYEMRISDWSSDVCSSDLPRRAQPGRASPDAAAQGSGGGHPARDTHRRGLCRRLAGLQNQIGRASCRARVCQYV